MSRFLRTLGLASPLLAAAATAASLGFTLDARLSTRDENC